MNPTGQGEGPSNSWPPPLPAAGSKRKETETTNQGTPCLSVSSSTPSVDHGTPDVVVVNDEAEDVGGKRQKKCTSEVWQYFTKRKETVEMNGKKYEQLWGYCNFPNCKAKYRAESSHGTTGFRHHLKSAHSIVKGQQQLKTEKDYGKDITVVEPYRYDPEVSLKKLYLAIIMHEYPFIMVEHEYFVDFVKSMRPNFPLKSRVTARKEILDMYKVEKEKLYAQLKNVQCRFSATMDMWTSCQNKAYMCITIHWIDNDWHIQKRIIGFFHVEGRHTGKKLAATFSETMVKWCIESKLFSLSLDNASANEVAVNDIITDLKDSIHGSLVCDGMFFHIRCACHILNLVARDGMNVIARTIGKIKSLVQAVKGSPLQWEELMKYAVAEGLKTDKGIQTDVSTRWNSTYLMLRDVLYYKAAFMRLKPSDRARYERISPSIDEWEKATTISLCLKKFYDLTVLFSGTLYPTANLFYKGFCEIKDLLDKWKVGVDVVIQEMATSMSIKFEKYWNMSSTSLAVACFLDPRYKKRLIEFYMKKFYGDFYQYHLDEFVNGVKKLYQFYASSSAPAKSNMNTTTNPTDRDPFMEEEDIELESFLYDDACPDRDDLNELDRYMAEPLLKQSEFDILMWWKNHTEEYPVLSQIARDVMAIQVSTVASESAFSAGGRVVDPIRSRLDPEIVQALICTKDWVAAGRKDSKNVPSLMSDLDLEDMEAFVDMLIQKDEDEIASDPDVMNDADEI